jgi:DNA-binding response OmpR family regulator
MADILLIEDDAELRLGLRLNLERFGHRVAEAAGGRDALEFFCTSAAEVVVTDLFMPDKDGFEIITEMNRRWPNLPIIAMSGGGRLAPGINLRIATRLGAKRVLAKPFSIAELNEAVVALVRGPEAPQHPRF